MSERAKLSFALIASALLHVLALMVMVLWAWLHPADLASKAPPKKLEVTLVRSLQKPTPAPVPPAKPIPAPTPERKVISSEGLQASSEAAAKSAFESDRNMKAASELPATGNAPLPSQAGKERPFNEFENKQYSLGRPDVAGGQNIAEQQSTSAQQSKRVARALNDTLPTVGIGNPISKASSAVAQQKPANSAPGSRGGFQRQTERTRIEGSISNRGRNSVNAVATPLGRYRKAVADAIGSRWYYYINQRMDLITVGNVHIKFQVDPLGRVQNLSVLSNSANETFANYCLQSITQAKIPPIPPDLVPKLESGRLEIEYTFTIYPQ